MNETFAVPSEPNVSNPSGLTTPKSFMFVNTYVTSVPTGTLLVFKVIVIVSPSFTFVADGSNVYVGGVDESNIFTATLLFFHCSPPKFELISETETVSVPSIL